jgi:hypothetical protein
VLVKPFFPNLALRARIAATQAARAEQARFFDMLAKRVEEHQTHALDHVRACAECKAKVKANLERGLPVPEEIREAAGIAKVLS